MTNREKVIVGLMILFAGSMLNGCGSLAEQFDAIGREKFDKVVDSGNLKEIESILAKKPEWVNGRYGSNPLRIAAGSGNKEAVELLIAKGADINYRGDCTHRGDATPLESATRGGYKDIVELLIAKGANVNVKACRTGETPLEIAERKGYKEIAEILREQTLAVEDVFNAVKQENLAKVKSMLTEKPELLLNRSKHYQTLLHQAVLDEQKEIAEFLIAKGANIYAKNGLSDAPLHSAVKAGHKDLVALLLAKGADVNMTAYQDYTPLHIATKSENVEMVEFLISKGANVNLRGRGGTGKWTGPLDIAAENGYVDITKLLIANEAEVNSKDYGGRTALFYAAREGHKEIVKILIDNGANVNARLKPAGTTGRELGSGKKVKYYYPDLTPLFLAVSNGHKETAKILIDHGAKVDVKLINNLTPLHVAAERGNKEIAKLLLDNGAKVNIKTRKSKMTGWLNPPPGTTPLNLATTDEVAELLIARGANVNNAKNLNEHKRHLNRGMGYTVSGRFEKAIESFKKAISLKPDSAFVYLVYVALGEAYVGSGRFDEAIESLKKAISLKPDLSITHVALGSAYSISGRFDEAIEPFKNAISLKPDLAKAHFGLAVAYVGSGRFEEAIEPCKNAISLKPDLAEAHFVLGEAYNKLGDKDGALAQYEILKTLDKDKANKLLEFINK